MFSAKIKIILAFLAYATFVAGGRICPTLLSNLKSGKISEAIIELPSIMDQIESSSRLQSLNGEAKVKVLVDMLETLTANTQKPLMKAINKLGLQAQQFWASNIILIKAVDLGKLKTLATTVEGDFLIREQYWASIKPQSFAPIEANITQSVQWGVAKIRAPEAWTLNQGEGVVVGVIDTGVNEGHIGLTEGYAGAWLDPYFNTSRPTDEYGHGSHVMGSILGRTNGIGVAPGARWIACRGLNHYGTGSEAALTTCAEFFITTNPKPQIASNSWGFGSVQTWYNQQISAWRNAGIIPIFAIGGFVPHCGNADSPGDQPNLISVGATRERDGIAGYSARGPSTTGARKPEVSAPGEFILSCGTGNDNYYNMSSMASRNVAGAVALLLSQNPFWGFVEVRSVLGKTAVHPPLTNADRGCGLEIPGQDFPNNVFGDGRIDDAAALGIPMPTQVLTTTPITTMDPNLIFCLNKTDDDSYFRGCRDEEMKEFVCPFPLLFNPKLGVCDYQDQGVCGISCLGKPDGALAHPCDCSLYVLCREEVVAVTSCSAPLLFDSSLFVCNFPDLVNCVNI